MLKLQVKKPLCASEGEKDQGRGDPGRKMLVLHLWPLRQSLPGTHVDWEGRVGASRAARHKGHQGQSLQLLAVRQSSAAHGTTPSPGLARGQGQARGGGRVHRRA